MPVGFDFGNMDMDNFFIKDLNFQETISDMVVYDSDENLNQVIHTGIGGKQIKLLPLYIAVAILVYFGISESKISYYPIEKGCKNICILFYCSFDDKSSSF